MSTKQPLSVADTRLSVLTKPAGLAVNTYRVNPIRRDLSWPALCTVVIVHLTLLAAFREQTAPETPETRPVPIMVRLVNPGIIAQTIPNASDTVKPHRESTIMTKRRADKPLKKTVKPAKTSHTKPVEKPVSTKRQPATPLSMGKSTPPPARAASDDNDVVTKAQKNNTASNNTPFQAPGFNAGYLHNPPPRYPTLSKRRGEQGRVLLRVLVSADGAALSVTLQASSGSDRLDEAAMAAVRNWRFVPAKRSGQAVSAFVTVPIKFSLGG